MDWNDYAQAYYILSDCWRLTESRNEYYEQTELELLDPLGRKQLTCELFAMTTTARITRAGIRRVRASV